jgi:hypothetical protein
MNFDIKRKISTFIELPICCANDENIFLGIHTVHFCQKLIDYTICSATYEQNINTLNASDYYNMSIPGYRSRPACFILYIYILITDHMLLAKPHTLPQGTSKLKVRQVHYTTFRKLRGDIFSMVCSENLWQNAIIFLFIDFVVTLTFEVNLQMMI